MNDEERNPQRGCARPQTVPSRPARGTRSKLRLGDVGVAAVPALLRQPAASAPHPKHTHVSQDGL